MLQNLSKTLPGIVLLFVYGSVSIYQTFTNVLHDWLFPHHCDICMVVFDKHYGPQNCVKDFFKIYYYTCIYVIGVVSTLYNPFKKGKRVNCYLMKGTWAFKNGSSL